MKSEIPSRLELRSPSNVLASGALDNLAESNVGDIESLAAFRTVQVIPHALIDADCGTVREFRVFGRSVHSSLNSSTNVKRTHRRGGSAAPITPINDTMTTTLLNKAAPPVDVPRLVRLLDSGDAASHLMIDISGRGLPIADALEACGLKIVRVRKNGDGWSAVNP